MVSADDDLEVRIGSLKGLYNGEDPSGRVMVPAMIMVTCLSHKWMDEDIMHARPYTAPDWTIEHFTLISDMSR